MTAIPNGKIIQGDCLQIMRRWPAETFGLIVTSPPYNIKNSTGNGLKNGAGGKWPNARLQKGYAGHNDTMPHKKYVQWQRDCLTEMLRLLRDDGALFYNHKWRVQNGLLQDRADIMAGLPVRQIIIWQRSGGINFNPGYFLPNYEVIYLLCKPRFKLAPKANAIGSVWRIHQETGNPHPAPLPHRTRCPLHHRRRQSPDPRPLHRQRHHRHRRRTRRPTLDRNRTIPEYVALAEQRIQNARPPQPSPQ